MTPPSARIRPGISILYLRKACAHATSSDPPSRNAPHTVVRVRLRASYDFGGDTSTHAPATIPATQPSTIATLYTRNGGTGYGELSMPPPQNFPELMAFWSAFVVPSNQTPSAFTPTFFCRATTILEPLEPRPVYFHARGTTPLPSSVALYDWWETTPSTGVPRRFWRAFQVFSPARPSAVTPSSFCSAVTVSRPNRPSSATFLDGAGAGLPGDTTASPVRASSSTAARWGR